MAVVSNAGRAFWANERPIDDLHTMPGGAASTSLFATPFSDLKPKSGRQSLALFSRFRLVRYGRQK
jgi:hypothetical protein